MNKHYCITFSWFSLQIFLEIWNVVLLFFTTAVFLNACWHSISVVPLCVCMSDPPVRPSGTAGPRPPPRVAKAAAAGAAPGRHEQEGEKAPGGLADPIRQALWVSPGCRSRPPLFSCSSCVALFASHGRRFPGAPLGTAVGAEGCYWCHGPGVFCACLVFYQLNLQPVFACVWTGQLPKAKWNVWSSSSTRWWPRPAASLLGPASTAPCSETRCTTPLAWRMTWCWTEVRRARSSERRARGWHGAADPTSVSVPNSAVLSQDSKGAVGKMASFLSLCVTVSP